MKLVKLLSLAALATVTLGATQASALSEDEKSMNSSDGAARFSDPDEKTPGALYMQNGQAASGSGNVDPSSVRYDYDSASGSYVPHRN